MSLARSIALATMLAGGLASVAVAGPRELQVTDALIWAGESGRVARSKLDTRDREAIRSFERRVGLTPDGELDPEEMRVLARAAELAKRREGYTVMTDRRTGVRLGLPREWLSSPKKTDEGTRWASPDRAIVIEALTSQDALESLVAGEEKVAGRSVSYREGGRDWAVLSGLEEDGTRLFYVRMDRREGRVRGFRVTYEKALSHRLDRVVAAMSSDFIPFAAPEEATIEVRRLPPPTAPALPRAAAQPTFTAGGKPLATAVDLTLPVRGPRIEPKPRPRTIATLDGEVELDGREPSEGRPDLPDDPPPLNAPAATVPPLDTRPTGSIGAADGHPMGRVGLAPGSSRAGEGPVEEPGTELFRLTGMMTDEGASCPTLRAPDGALYALVGDVPETSPGTLVAIEGVGITADRCSSGRAVAVGAFKVIPIR